MNKCKTHLLMKRYCYEKLEQWKASCNRKPLVLMGARQVGKTFLLKIIQALENMALPEFIK